MHIRIPADPKARYELAYAALFDAANFSMRKAKRERWSRADYNAGVRTFNMVMREDEVTSLKPTRKRAPKARQDGGSNPPDMFREEFEEYS